MLPPNSNEKWETFLQMSDDQQRDTVNNVPYFTHFLQKAKAEEYLRLFFEIIKKIKGEPKLITYTLMLIDGILEDNRNRIQYLVSI